MRIIDEEGREIKEPNFDLGRYVGEEEIFKEHHDANPGVPEVGHFEVTAVYPNGGKDVEWIVDVPGIPSAPEWDEYETIIRWHWYTEEEREEYERQKSQPRTEDLLNALLGVTE